MYLHYDIVGYDVEMSTGEELPTLPSSAPVETEPPFRLDRDSAVPLWSQLLADLRRRLAAREFDEAFPSELALVESYAVSRTTVREALRRLRSDGTVISGRGRRPRLSGTADIEQPLGALYSLFASVERAGMKQRSHVRQKGLCVDPAVADRLGLRPSTELFHVERLRLADEKPLAVDEAWFPASLAAPLLDADFSHTSLYRELARRTGVRLTGGKETIRARVPSPVEQEALGIGPGVAVFSIDRLGCVSGHPVEWRHTVVRGDTFSVVAEFTPGIGYRLGAADLAGRAPRAV